MDEKINIKDFIEYMSLYKKYSESMESQKHIVYENNVQLLTDDSIKRLFAKARKVKNVIVSELIYAVLRLDDTFAPYRSLLLSIDGEILTSKETTSIIMKRTFEALSLTYEEQLEYAKLLYQSKSLYRLPYVYAGRVYLPELGPSKNACSWYALHLVNSFSEDAKYGDVILTFHNRTSITVPMKNDAFQRQLERAAFIRYTQHKTIELVMKEFMPKAIYTKHKHSHNLVDRYIEEHSDDFHFNNTQCKALMTYIHIIQLIKQDEKYETVRQLIKELMEKDISL